MKRQTSTFSIQNFTNTKQQLLFWANQFDNCCFLDNNQYPSLLNSTECLVAVGAVQIFDATQHSLKSLQAVIDNQHDWLFGHISYDFKNQLYPSLTSQHPDKIGFPDCYFFQPETVVQLNNHTITISCLSGNPAKIYATIAAQENTPHYPKNNLGSLQNRISKQQYIESIQQIQAHILRGDCYEINFCQEFFAENSQIQPLATYQQLTQISPNPFSCYYKLNDKYLLCASPERYLKKEGLTLFSQPIKGTIKRNTVNADADAALAKTLQNSKKDQSENVMVVDLVRNDLSKICQQGSVLVKELFGIYTFPQVHQMISTITGTIDTDESFINILQATFPMGSMTGAPKLRVMQLIEQYEQTQRGLYSGAVGYIRPNHDFDFNVVIRSILYNQSNNYVSYQVGSGITYNSIAEEEYEECLLKAEAIKQVLE